MHSEQSEWRCGDEGCCAGKWDNFDIKWGPHGESRELQVCYILCVHSGWYFKVYYKK